MEALIHHLTQIYAARAATFRQFEPALQVYAGLEDASASYFWDGLKRHADPDHPFLIFQYTLDGWGYYRDASGQTAIRPRTAFTALVPSDHRYYRPATSSRWLVLWLVLHHPYIIQRVTRRQKECGPFFSLDPGHPLLLRAVELFEGNCAGTNYDAITHEQSLFAFLWEYERVMNRANVSHGRRERLVDDVRQYIVSEIHRSIDVSELAARQGMSQSHFSHSFSAVAGVTPAQYVQRVRLEAAAYRLLHSNQTIEQIASETGFATATHFCRIFRQRYHLSPGEFRRQMR